VLLLMWSGGCVLAALSSAALSGTSGSWLLGVAAIMCAQAAVLAGRAARLPSPAAWAVAVGCAAVGAVGHSGTDLLVYLGLGAALLVLADRFAVLALDLSTFCVPNDDAGGRRALHPTTLADPIAREFARARRDQAHLVVASISVPRARGASRRLARIAHDLVPSVRRTDAIVRAITDRLVVVLPGGDDVVAVAVVGRALADEHADVLVGTATFPEDGPTWALLKDVAQAREQPWPPAGPHSDRFNGDRAALNATAQRAETAEP
jgi:hypothetical protein